MAKLKAWDWVLTLLTGVALLNWGLVAWFDFNLVEWITFGMSWLTKTVYTIVAIVGLFTLGRLVMLALKKI